MYIWSGQIQAAPGNGAALGAKLAPIRDTMSSIGERPVHLWAVASGRPIGTYIMSTRVEGTADVIDLQMKLAASGEYQQQAGESGKLTASPTETYLNRVVGSAGDPGEPKPIVTVTRGRIAGGNLVAAMAWSQEILEYSCNLTGLSGLLTTSASGPMFEVGWVGGFDSGAQVDEANNALTTDAGYIGLLERAGGMFIDGSSERALLVQLP